jgi:hypothetical protein
MSFVLLKMIVQQRGVACLEPVAASEVCLICQSPVVVSSSSQAFDVLFHTADSGLECSLLVLESANLLFLIYWVLFGHMNCRFDVVILIVIVVVIITIMVLV